MYPKIYFDYFREFDRKSEVFVAMPFTNDFNHRWTEIFIPGIKKVGLIPVRVDFSTVSDSILIDILKGIGSSKFVLVDTSCQKNEGQCLGPNPNVMFELGIAQAIRLPEEVIVIRDEQSITENPFDISHIRYNKFDSQNIKASISLLSRLIIDAQRVLDITRDLIVERILKTLDPDEMWFHGTIGSQNTFDLYPFDPDRKELYELGYRESSKLELRSLARGLIRLGLLEAGNPGPPKKQVYGVVPEYKVTALGKAVWERMPYWSKEKGRWLIKNEDEKGR